MPTKSCYRIWAQDCWWSLLRVTSAPSALWSGRVPKAPMTLSTSLTL